MYHCGRSKDKPFLLNFNPHLNALIGGRGTGKSTVIESIRIATRNDEGLEQEAPATKEQLDNFMGFSSSQSGVILNDTEINVTINHKGSEYRLIWNTKTEGAALRELQDNQWVELEAGNLKERFPITIFSQKQINELASNPRGLLQLIDRDDDVNKVELDMRLHRLKNEFLELRRKKRDLENQLSDEVNLKAKLKDVEHDLKQYDQAILQEFQLRNTQNSALPDDSPFDFAIEKLEEIIDEIEFPDFPDASFENDATYSELKTIYDTISEKFYTYKNNLRSTVKDYENLKEFRTEKIKGSKWYQLFEQSKIDYENLLKEYEEKGEELTIATYKEWVEEKNRILRHLGHLKGVRSEIKIVESNIEEVFERIIKLREELFEKRKKFIEKVIGQNEYVRMNLEPYGDTKEIEKEYRLLLGIGESVFANQIYNEDGKMGILNDIINCVDYKRIPELLTKIKKESLLIAQGKKRSSYQTFDSRLATILDERPAAFDELDLLMSEDLLTVKYSRASSKKFEVLERGSDGQKAAAILAFILSYGDNPLIIDQPEDDLDNELIYDLIVKQIHNNKERRQLIIATHDANIVVNGDSELVNVLHFKNGQIELKEQGGLNEAEIRKDVCLILEGGEQAFEKRYKRMALAKEH